LTKRIWLIGGTQESAILAQAIQQANLSCLISVTTDSAVSLYPIASSIEVIVAKFSPDQLSSFLINNQISVILDCSHPFAVEISRTAIATACQLKIPYLRFEREEIISPNQSGIQYVASFERLLSQNLLLNQRTLLTIGYRYLPLFQPWQTKAMLFARILPSQIALETALNSGFTSDRIMAFRPPISLELERSLWQHWQITTVVTKASGTPGGEDTKRKIAAELGIQLIIVERPIVEYPQFTSSVSEALNFCRQFLQR
jgi:precorrin-6A/cobalt-precorrin-6A reductase